MFSFHFPELAKSQNIDSVRLESNYEFTIISYHEQVVIATSIVKKVIHWFATQNGTKAQVVERFDRTSNSKMFNYFTTYRREELGLVL